MKSSVTNATKKSLYRANVLSILPLYTAEILSITNPASYTPHRNHVSNAQVRRLSRCPPVSQLVSSRHLYLFGHVTTVASPEFCSRGARARGARVPKFVVTKSSRSESHLALGLQNVRAFANSRGHVPQCPMSGDATA